MGMIPTPMYGMDHYEEKTPWYFKVLAWWIIVGALAMVGAIIYQKHFAPLHPYTGEVILLDGGGFCHHSSTSIKLSNGEVITVTGIRGKLGDTITVELR